VYCFFPETNQLNLEDVDHLFEKGGVTGGVFKAKGKGRWSRVGIGVMRGLWMRRCLWRGRQCKLRKLFDLIWGGMGSRMCIDGSIHVKALSSMVNSRIDGKVQRKFDAVHTFGNSQIYL
jgi:hypothetical protein